MDLFSGILQVSFKRADLRCQCPGLIAGISFEFGDLLLEAALPDIEAHHFLHMQASKVSDLFGHLRSILL